MVSFLVPMFREKDTSYSTDLALKYKERGKSAFLGWVGRNFPTKLINTLKQPNTYGTRLLSA